MKLLNLCLIAFLFIAGSFANAQSCRQERTIGADYMQAKYNCEVVLNGYAGNCTPYGSMWGCSCALCPTGGAGNHFSRTIGTSYNQARYNCEVVLNGNARNCQPSTNGLWYCDCSY